MAGTAQSRINGSWSLVLKVAGLFIAAGGLSLAVASFATSGLNKQITSISGDVTKLRERTTVVETRQPDDRGAIRRLEEKVDTIQTTVTKILERLPPRAGSSPVSERYHLRTYPTAP